MRAQEVGVQREQVPVADGDVHDRLDTELGLDKTAGGQRAHPALRTGAVSNVHGVDMARSGAQLVQRIADIETSRRGQLRRDDEFAALDALREAGRL